jgi:serine/threonine protein kinase
LVSDYLFLFYFLNKNNSVPLRYFAVELFDATLEQFCNGHYEVPMQSDLKCLFQISLGINYLHIRKIITHGQLNPASILISQSLRVQIKISQCGLLGKVVHHLKANPPQESRDLKMIVTSHHPTCWMLPESWLTSPDEDGNEIITPNPTTYGDVFAAGCIFFYFLKRGLHPFGFRERNSILSNIKKLTQ